MRASFVAAGILGFLPAFSLACSCIGTQSIGNSLTLADAVVVGKVIRHTEADYSDNQRPALIDVEVIQLMKGSAKGNIEIAKTLMCYQSFPEDDFEVGKSYVFPLEQIDLANPDQAWGLMIGSDRPVPSHKMFRLPTCAHNGLLLQGQSLYTSEPTAEGVRRLEYYMPLFVVRVLLPLGLLSLWGILAAAVLTTVLVTLIAIRRRSRKATHAV